MAIALLTLLAKDCCSHSSTSSLVETGNDSVKRTSVMIIRNSISKDDEIWIGPIIPHGHTANLPLPAYGMIVSRMQ